MPRQSSKVPRICEHCGSHFLVWPFKIRQGKGKYCSVSCRARALGFPPKKVIDPVTRSWTLVNKDGPIPVSCPHLGPCWIWTGTINNNSHYGQFAIGPRGESQLYRAHRYSYKLHFGPIPDGLSVLHHCDIRACVCPKHLFLGTQADNIADMVSKDRQAKGVRHGKSIVTPEIVRQGRLLYASGKTGPQVAEELGIPRMTAWNFITRKTWQHLD
jgi:HNH endonuclease